MTGVLTVRGRTRPLTLEAATTIQGDGEAAEVHAYRLPHAAAFGTATEGLPGRYRPWTDAYFAGRQLTSFTGCGAAAASDRLRLEYRVHDGVAIVDADGEIDVFTCGPLRNRLLALQVRSQATPHRRPAGA